MRTTGDLVSGRKWGMLVEKGKREKRRHSRAIRSKERPKRLCTESTKRLAHTEPAA